MDELSNLSQNNYIEQISIDCVIFGYQKKQLKVLVAKLAFQGDYYALPSGFIYQEEDIDAAAKRILWHRTGIENIYLEQFYVFGKAGRNSKAFLDHLIANNPQLKKEEIRDQREYNWFTKRFISIGYYALVDINQVELRQTTLDESISWHPVDELPGLILDHNQLVQKALYSLRRDLDEKISAFKLLPDTFTMKEVQGVYESIFKREFVRTNFQKKILDLNVLERLGKQFTGAANKAPYLYRFKNN